MSEASVQARAARVAGALYVITNVTAVAALTIRTLVAGSGDVGSASQAILGSQLLYRTSIALDVATTAGVIILIWALYLLLRPFNRNLALLAIGFRLVENAVLAVSAVTLLLAVRVLSRPDYLGAIDQTQLEAIARLIRGAHGLGFTVGFVFLGLGSTVFAWMLLKSGYVPRPLAGWGVAASALIATCAFLMMLFPAGAGTFQLVSFIPMGIYEVGLGAWLWTRGARLAA